MVPCPVVVPLTEVYEPSGWIWISKGVFEGAIQPTHLPAKLLTSWAGIACCAQTPAAADATTINASTAITVVFILSPFSTTFDQCSSASALRAVDVESVGWPLWFQRKHGPKSRVGTNGLRPEEDFQVVQHRFVTTATVPSRECDAMSCSLLVVASAV